MGADSPAASVGDLAALQRRRPDGAIGADSDLPLSNPQPPRAERGPPAIGLVGRENVPSVFYTFSTSLHAAVENV